MTSNSINSSALNTSTITIPTQKLWIIGLMLYFSNFMDLGNYMPFFLLPFAFLFVLRNKIHLNLLFLFSFCAVYCSFLFYYGIMENGAIMLRLLSPVTLYAVGYYLIKKAKSFDHTYKLIMVMILSISIYGILCTLYTVYVFGSISYSSEVGRIAKIIWTGKIISATGLNTYLSMGFVLFPLIFVKTNLLKSRHLKLFLLAVFIMCVYSTFIVGNRTGLVQLFATCIIVFLFASPFSVKKLLLTFIGSSLAFLIYYSNILGMRFFIENSSIFRGDTNDYLQDPRFTLWKTAFNGMFEYPLGGAHSTLRMSGGHNVWLDVAYQTGVIPFILIVIFTVYSLFSVAHLVRSNAPTVLKVLVLGLTTCFMIIFIMEPILLGWMSCFNAFCLLIGVVQSLNVMMENKVLTSHATDK